MYSYEDRIRAVSFILTVVTMLRILYVNWGILM